MRMLKVALVLFVLASFIVAVAAVATAATVTPTAKPKVTATAKPTATMMPTKKPGKLIDLNQMKYNIDGIYKKLMAGVKMPGSAAYNKSSKGAPATEINRSGGMTNQTKGAAGPAKPTVTAKPSKKLSTPGMRPMPASMPLANGGMLPQLAGNKTKTK